MPTFMRIRPITGKFLSVYVDGVIQNIYTLHPNASPDKEGKIPAGTEVPFEIGKKILAIYPPVASPVPQIKDNKFVPLFSEEEKVEDSEKVQSSSKKSKKEKTTKDNTDANTSANTDTEDDIKDTIKDDTEDDIDPFGYTP